MLICMQHCILCLSLNDIVYGFAGYLMSNDDENRYKYIVV